MGGKLCLEEMAQVLMVKVQEPEEGWGEALGKAWEERVEAALGQVPVEIVCVLVVGQGFLTRLVVPATTWIAPSVAQR